MDVLRIRLAVVVTLAALIAPWMAPCLMAGPADHAAMPCCHQTGPVGPAARPCCTSEGQQPAPPAPSAASFSVVPVSLELPAVLLAIPHPLHAASPRLPIQPRPQYAVLLI